MANTGLINHGWSYINIDDYWEYNAGWRVGTIRPWKESRRAPKMARLTPINDSPT